MMEEAQHTRQDNNPAAAASLAPPLLPAMMRHLDELGVYRGLCATGSTLGTDWVDVQPSGCDSWVACDSFADCVASGTSETCLCCAPGSNQAGYVYTQAEMAICACPTVSSCGGLLFWWWRWWVFPRGWSVCLFVFSWNGEGF
jgi:hypothetical protein